MLIGYSAVDEKPTCLCEDTPASTPTSRGGLSDGVHRQVSDNVRRLVMAIGTEERSVKGMMVIVGLKDRKNFIEYSLAPAIHADLVQMKFPDSPRHPRQRYSLTDKGLALYDEIREH